MKGRLAVALSAFVLVACAEPPSTPSVTPDDQSNEAPVLQATGEPISGSYIVVFKDDVADPGPMARSLTSRHFGKLNRTYTSVIRGFAAELTPQAVNGLRSNRNIAYIEEDQVYTIQTTQTGATWGIDRIDQRNRPLSGTYTYTANGSGVRAYIIDTGIQTSHSQFGGRASNVFDALGGNGNDCNGHGTHVAGTVGGSTYGVAKGVSLRGVRVLSCAGSGSTSGIIAALDWVRLNAQRPAVANMSLGGGASTSLNNAVNALSNSGVFVAVAAGNSNANACNTSPAGASAVTTVASSTSTDAKSSFSNHGTCVELYAPGSSITSAWLNGGTNTISGTSMASPHVAGVAALYKSANGETSSSALRTWLTTNATAGVITGNPSGTPNRLLYKSTL